MWPNTAVGDRYLVSFVGVLAGQRIMSTYWYRVQELGAVVTVEECMDALNDRLAAGDLVPTYLACVPTNYVLAEIWIQRIRPSRLLKGVYTYTQNGTNGTANTANVSGVITRRGLPGTRSAISSLHLPMADIAANSVAGILTENMQDFLNAHAAEVEMRIVTQAGPLIVWDPIIDNGDGAQSYTPIATAFAEDTTRVMRRRTVRYGV